MVDDNVLKQLYERFELRTRKGVGNQQFKYVPSTDVIDRMNKVFKGRWSTKVLSSEIIEDFIVVRVMVQVAPNDRESFCHEGYGSSAIARFGSGPKEGKIIDIGNSYKGALSTAIRNACTRYGVGLYLEGDHWTDGEYESSDDGDSDVMPPTFAPPSLSRTEVSPSITEPTFTIPTASSPASEPVVVDEQEMTPPTVQLPLSETKSKKMSPPPTASMTPVVELKEEPPVTVEKVKNVMPKIPSPANGNSTTPPMSSTKPSYGGPVGGITDVQLAALDALLNLRGVKYEDLALAAFEANTMDTANVPAMDQLTYKQAVAVISYGNHLYRKQ
jgi:hypothetical protein